MGFVAMDVTKPYEFIGFGDIHGPKLYEIHGASRGVYFADAGSEADMTANEAK